MSIPGESNAPREETKIIYDHELPNCPGKSAVCVQLEYAPNGFSPPHRHSGTVLAVVLEGEAVSGVDDNPPEVYGPGGTFMMKPGSRHTVSENNSRTERVKVLVTLIVDTQVLKDGGYKALTVFDED